MNNMKVKSAKDKYKQLSELGSKLNLSFSSHMVIGNKLLALDGIKKCLLVLEANNESYIIELNKVTSIAVKMTYSSKRSGVLNNEGIEEYLNTIELQFEYSNKGKICLPFYNCQKDDPQDLPKLERNAKNWHMILSKIACVPTYNRIKEKDSFLFIYQAKYHDTKSNTNSG
jgi:hypothetical protein